FLRVPMRGNARDAGRGTGLLAISGPFRQERVSVPVEAGLPRVLTVGAPNVLRGVPLPSRVAMPGPSPLIPGPPGGDTFSVRRFPCPAGPLAPAFHPIAFARLGVSVARVRRQ